MFYFCSWKPGIKKIKKWQCGQFFDLNPTCASVGHNTNLIQRQQSIFSIIYTLRSSSMSVLNFLLNQWQNNWWLIITNSANILFLRELQTHLIGGAKDSSFGLNHLIKTFYQKKVFNSVIISKPRCSLAAYNYTIGENWPFLFDRGFCLHFHIILGRRSVF